MVTITYRTWTLRVDPVLTRATYAARPAPDWTACCDTCENFEKALAERRIFPTEILQLFEDLGIDSQKATEQTEWAESRPGWHTYTGWYHVAGELVAGPDANVPQPEGGSQVILEPITEDFRLGFTRDVDLVSDQLAGQPVVQVEFWADVPWLLSDPPYQRMPQQH